MKTSKIILTKYEPLLLFLLGFGIFMFTRRSNVVTTIPISILIAPIFILRFIRTQPKKRGIWLTLLGFMLSMNIALWSLFKFDEVSIVTVFSLIRSSLIAVLWLLPFMTDRLVYDKYKRKGILSTLTFPIIITAIFLLTSLDGPFDSGGVSQAKYSYGSMIIKQAQSLFGIWILVFVYSWSTSIINYFWENQFKWGEIKKLIIIYPSVLLLIFLFGVIKTSSLVSPKSDPVKIAAVVLIPEDGKAVNMGSIFNKKLTSPFKETISRIEELTEKAAKNDAKIVSFQEFAITINEEDETKLKKVFEKIAKENNIYLSISYAYFAKKGKGENKHLFINPNGEIELDYSKRYIWGFGPYGATAVFRKGAEIIQSTDTPYGRIGIAVCRDMGFASFMKQAAKANVDIMLGPSYDFPKSYSPGYILSTVENGFSFVRPTYNGTSHATDYNGKVLTTMDFDKTEDGIMYADVPTKGIKTLYPMIGDLLGWLCVLGMLVLMFFPKKMLRTESK